MKAEHTLGLIADDQRAWTITVLSGHLVGKYVVNDPSETLREESGATSKPVANSSLRRHRLFVRDRYSARMATSCTRLLWLLPLALFSEDALAWGLCTHVYFAQLLIWAIPLADARFRRAVARLPELMLAGACLPDVALFSRPIGAPTLTTTHQWSAMQRLLAGAHDDESRALVVGYASHLLADVIAHNHFVPAHEQIWFDRPVVTHAASEWAMDAHIMPHLLARPADLMRRHGMRIADYATEHFRCGREASRRALGCRRRWRSTRVSTTGPASSSL